MSTVKLSQSRAVPVPVEEASTGCCPTRCPKCSARRRLSVPPIKDVRGQVGEWGSAGETRTIVLSDGGTMLETLTDVRRPRDFGYTITDVTGAMKPLVSSAVGRWSIEPAGTGTRITWTWELTPTSLGRLAMPAFGAGPPVSTLALESTSRAGDDQFRAVVSAANGRLADRHPRAPLRAHPT